MMESYDRHPVAPLFFVIFLIIALYIITNVLLGMVYSVFKDIQKEKFKELYLHRRYIYIHTYVLLNNLILGNTIAYYYHKVK